METQIVRLGSELVVEIPEEMVAEAGFVAGEQLEWAVDGRGRISLRRPADLVESRSEKGLTIEELLEGVPEGGVGGEYDWGPPQGVEFW